MNHVLRSKAVLIPTVFFLLALSGCSTMMETVSPPDALVKIELKGPYDKEIPEKFVVQLKGASIVSDWAIPYIFLSIGMYFESLGDEMRTLHFFDRARVEFRNRKDSTGEGSALNRKVFALYEFGKIQDAFNAIREAEQTWSRFPLNAFVAHNYGHYYLMNGDYLTALDYFRKSLQFNSDFRKDFNLLMLRRDSELEYGISVILADYFPAMSQKFGFLDFDEMFYQAIRKNVDEGIAHLNQALDLNNEIRKTKVGRFTSENIFQIMEANVYNFLGLSYAIKGISTRALGYLDNSLELAKKANFRSGEIDGIFFRNQVYLLEKNINAGQKAARQLNEIADKYQLPFYQIWAKFILSRYYLGFGDSSQAISLLKEAMVIMETQRAGLVVDRLKETYMFNRQVLYEALIELLAKEGDQKGAFEIAERAKSRILVDLLAGRDIGRTEDETALIKQGENYIQEIAAGYRKMLPAVGGGADAQKVLAQIEKAQAGHRAVIMKIKEQNEELCSLISVEPPAVDDIRNLLDENTTIFSYFVADKILYIWALNKNRIHLERIKIGKKDVAALVSSFNA
ncbi:MAG TPA: hypothetical protein PK114_09100, partial [Smithellaceae bacterium]|nr:hypothetical protein [Smithellaceae bacterium]